MFEDSQLVVFLSRSSYGKAAMHQLTRRLHAGEVKMWFDVWGLKLDGSISVTIQEDLERSRVLVPCMAANELGSNLAELEFGSLRISPQPFRDPPDKQRRFLPLLVDNAPIKGLLASSTCNIASNPVRN